MTRRYLRVAEAAEYLNLRPQTLNRWRCEGGRLSFTKAGRLVLYDVEDLDAFLRNGKRQSTSASPTGPNP